MVAAAMLSVAALGAQPGKLDPRMMPRIGQVDERFQSARVEMVEVTGGRWAPYRQRRSKHR